MEMNPKIVHMPSKKLLGKRMKMSYGNNTTFELWKSFMPSRNTIPNRIGSDLFSVQIYDASFNFSAFDLDTQFEKWATVEVSSFDHVPPDMDTLTLEPGLYAVFLHKGSASDAPKTFSYIFGTWIPQSNYTLDHRPHFEILGPTYDRLSPHSEEEVWIPIK